MTSAAQEKLIKRLDELIKKGNEIQGTKRAGQYVSAFVVDSPVWEGYRVQTLACLTDLFGTAHPYTVEFGKLFISGVTARPGDVSELQTMQHFLQSAKEDVENGYLHTLRELVNAELFSNFLDMAQHLMDENFKDAAAVIAGSVLEGHLRQLSIKNEVDLTLTDTKGNVLPKMAEVLRTDLAKANVYTQTQAKQILGWLAIRNDAAHGYYDRYSKPEVKNMIQGINDFMVRYPA